MASRDFELYAGNVPACAAFIGNGASGTPGGYSLHTDDYDLNDEILPIGIGYYVNLVRGMLHTP